MAEHVQLAVIVPAAARAELVALSHRRSLEEGRTISVGHLVREALAAHTGVQIPPTPRRGRPAPQGYRHRHRHRPAAVLEG